MRRTLLIVFIAIMSFIMYPKADKAFSVWDVVPVSKGETVEIGDWLALTTWDQIAIDLGTYISNNVNIYPNLQYIYNQTGNLSKVNVTLENISINDILWDVYGTGTKTPSTSLGFIQVVDRSSIDGNAVHQILPPAPTSTPPYPGYDYFLVNDVRNTTTNNDYSIRLNYGVEMRTDQPIQGLTQVSFYASRGLDSSNDTSTMTTRNLTVQVSTNGSSWTTLGTVIPPTPSSTAYNFMIYVFDVPQNLQGNDLYVSILYNGEGVSQGKNRYYSRVVIDELNFTTT